MPKGAGVITDIWEWGKRNARRAGRFLGRNAGTAIDVAQTGLAITSELAKYVPILEDEVTVEVVGQPGASKQELYYLALAAANGIVRRFNNIVQFNPLSPPSFAALMIEYDAADHWVRCYLKYTTGTLSIAVDADGDDTTIDPAFSLNPDNLAVYRGPQCAVVGGNFDFVSSLPGIPSDPTAGSGAPQMPFEGQTILTSCAASRLPNPAPMTQNPPPTYALSATTGPFGPTVNPKPPGDNRSRGAVVAAGASQNPPPGQCCDKVMKLIPLAFAALTDPGSLAKEMFTPPTAGPTGS